MLGKMPRKCAYTQGKKALGKSAKAFKCRQQRDREVLQNGKMQKKKFAFFTTGRFLLLTNFSEERREPRGSRLHTQRTREGTKPDLKIH